MTADAMDGATSGQPQREDAAGEQLGLAAGPEAAPGTGSDPSRDSRPLRGLAVAALVVGIAGEVLARVPLMGRFAALGLGVVGVALGAVAVLRNPAGAPGSCRGIAVAGLTLGIVSIFDGLVGFSTVAATSYVISMIG